MNRAALDLILENSKKGICANLEGANLEGANLYRANLYGANLRGANLRGANLRGANLYCANLRGANLDGANLYGTNLYGANLDGANLRGANLRGANLRGAYLRGADLRGADLRGADLEGTRYGEGVPLTREPLQIGGLRWFVLVLDQHIKIGCELHTTDEWENFTSMALCSMAPDAHVFWAKYKPFILAAAKAHQDKPDER